MTKFFCVGRTIVSTVPPIDKKLLISCKHECLVEVKVVIDPIFARMHRA